MGRGRCTLVAMTTHVRDVSAAEFSEAVVERSRTVPVVVDFWAAWCGPCRVLGPTLERLAAEAEGTWELVKIDVDANQALAAQFGVQGIPTVIGFRNGEPVARFTGAIPENAIKQWLQQLVPSEDDLAAEQGRILAESGDLPAAEAAFRSVLERVPDHQSAGVGLAELLVDRGDAAEAVAILERLSPTDEVRRLLARARLNQSGGDLESLAEAAADESNLQAGLAYGRALAAAGRHREAFDVLLGVVSARAGDVSDEARQAILDLFEVLGDDPLVAEYRRKLANALF